MLSQEDQESLQKCPKCGAATEICFTQLKSETRYCKLCKLLIEYSFSICSVREQITDQATVEIQDMPDDITQEHVEWANLRTCPICKVGKVVMRAGPYCNRRYCLKCQEWIDD